MGVKKIRGYVGNFVASKHKILAHNLEFFLRPLIFFPPPIYYNNWNGGVNERGVKIRGVKEMFTVLPKMYLINLIKIVQGVRAKSTHWLFLKF